MAEPYWASAFTTDLFRFLVRAVRETLRAASGSIGASRLTNFVAQRGSTDALTLGWLEFFEKKTKRK